MRALVSIQHLRAIAAIAVVVSHCWPNALMAQAGVDIFFVISGFIMWTITAKPIGAVEYWWHRLVRVAPLYWIATLIMAAHQHADTNAIPKARSFFID